jgi:hypothetical protein
MRKGGNMPIFKTGEMFHASGYLIVTTNSFLTSEVKLVMGRGAAWILKMKVPGIDRVFGKMISETCGHLGRYGILFYQRYGALQVKYRFDEKARVELIEFSLRKLAEIARRSPESKFNINYPGIGNGGLSKRDVKSLLDVLPDNVCVWEKEEVLTWPIHRSSVVNHPAR